LIPALCIILLSMQVNARLWLEIASSMKGNVRAQMQGNARSRLEIARSMKGIARALCKEMPALNARKCPR